MIDAAAAVSIDARPARPHRRRAEPDAARARVGPDPFRRAPSGRRRRLVRAVARRGALPRPAARAFDVSWAGASAPRRPSRRRVPRLSARRLSARPARRSGSSRRRRAKSPIAARRRRAPWRRGSSGRRTAATRSAAAATRRGRSWTSCRRRFRPIACCSARSTRRAATGRAIRRTSTTPTTRRAKSISKRSTTSAIEDPDGYGFQRVYTDRRDDTVRVDARRRRGGPRRLSPVCYSLRVRCLLPERAGGRRAGRWRPATIPATPGSAATGRRRIPGCRSCRRPRRRGSARVSASMTGGAYR